MFRSCATVLAHEVVEGKLCEMTAACPTAVRAIATLLWTFANVRAREFLSVHARPW